MIDSGTPYRSTQKSGRFGDFRLWKGILGYPVQMLLELAPRGAWVARSARGYRVDVDLRERLSSDSDGLAWSADLRRTYCKVREELSFYLEGGTLDGRPRNAGGFTYVRRHGPASRGR